MAKITRFDRRRRGGMRAWPDPAPGGGPASQMPFYLLVALLMLLAFGAVWTWTGWRAELQPDRDTTDAPPTIDFTMCAGGARVNCVVDGDTFWIGGAKVRILDIDTPELSPPRCGEEERLGLAAKARLGELLNAGPVTLARAPGEDDRDRYGRLLRTVHVGGRSVGDTLIAEGLARPYGSGRRSWCG